MVMLCYVLAALCLVYCVGVVATKAAGTKFLPDLAGRGRHCLVCSAFLVQKGALDAFANRTAGGNRYACRRGDCLPVRAADPDRQRIFCKRGAAAFLYYCVGCTDEAKAGPASFWKNGCVGHIPI